MIKFPSILARSSTLLCLTLLGLTLLGAFGACGGRAVPESSSESSWLTCSTDAQCTGYGSGLLCDSGGYCADEAGNRVRRGAGVPLASTQAPAVDKSGLEFADAGESASGGAPASGGGGSSPDDTGNGGKSTAGASSGAAGGGGSSPEVTPAGVFAVDGTAGCALEPDQELGVYVDWTLLTMGTKADDAADSVTGPWQYARQYSVRLPAGYDNTMAYPVIIQGPGCGGTTPPYAFTALADVAIVVTILPPPNDIGHATNPGQGCFDDREGDDSVDFVFYEELLDLLKSKYCYDQNRVFAAGHSSGAWLANELGCKYSGNSSGYRIRGVLSHAGGLPTDPAYRPTCSEVSGEPLIDGARMAGIWIQETQDQQNPFAYTTEAINRAMAVNGCTIGTSYVTASLRDYPVDDEIPASTCREIDGCPAQYPLVVCELPSDSAAAQGDLAEPAFATFLQSVIAITK